MLALGYSLPLGYKRFMHISHRRRRDATTLDTSDTTLRSTRQGSRVRADRCRDGDGTATGGARLPGAVAPPGVEANRTIM